MSIPAELAGDAAWAMSTLRKRAHAYRLAHRYYAGDHRLAFATTRFRNTFGLLFSEFAANHCETVVDVTADRLHLSGFDDGDGADDAGASVRARALWEMEEMDLVADEAHHEALITGDGYVIVWPREDGLSVEVASQRAEECIVRYASASAQVRYAAKWWWDEDSSRGRLTLYYPDRLVRFRTPSRVTSANQLPHKTTAYDLIPDDDRDGPGVVPHAWGVVPVVHFGHKAGAGRLGVSDLRSVIPVQDALNKTILDALVGSEFAALPQRWATGVEVRPDKDDQRMRAGIERLMRSSNAASRFGQFETADMPGLVTWIDSWRHEIARVSGTPAHLMMLGGSSQPPSGEALKVSEARLIAKADGCTRRFGPRWAQLMTLALRMVQDPPEKGLRALWASTASRSEREQAELAEIKAAAGVPWAQRMRELGYSEAEITQMRADLEEERQREIDHGAVV